MLATLTTTSLCRVKSPVGQATPEHRLEIVAITSGE